MGEVKHDGGPAFPMPASETSIGGHYEQLGMSLRDYFAAQMLPRIGMGWPNDEHKMILARHCYEIADAMLAARKASPSLHEGERG